MTEVPTQDKDELVKAIAEFERQLPGWWWKIGVCSFSRDASCGPDREGPDKHLLEFYIFDDGFHADLQDETETCAEALRIVTTKALLAKAWCQEQPQCFNRRKQRKPRIKSKEVNDV